MKVFLCLGQSNMAGPKITGWDKEDDDRLKGVLLSNDINQWIPASNPINRFSTVRMQAIPGLNPAPTFAERVKKAFPNEEIALVSNARGSSKIKEWQKGERYFEEAVRRVKGVCGNRKIDGILWLQGEQDVVEECDYSVYAERFSKFIAGSQLNSEQEEFLMNIISYVCSNGDITKEIVVNEAPFDEKLSTVFGLYLSPLANYIDNIHKVVYPQQEIA